MLLMIGILFVIFILGFIGACRGLIKEIFSLAAIGFAAVFALPLGSILEPLLNHRLGLPVLLSAILSPVAAGFLIFLIVKLVGVLVERQILAQKKKSTQRINHIGGAVVGSLKGVVFILVFLIILYNFGAAAEAIKIFRLGSKDGLTGRLITLKYSLDKSVIGGLLKKANPLPQESFSIVDDLVDITRDPQALSKLVQDSEIEKLMHNPKIIKLTEDEELIRLISEHDFKGLLNNNSIAELLKDKELLNELKRIDIKGIIERVKSDTGEE